MARARDELPGKPGEGALTIVATGTTVTGEVEAAGVVKIEGTVLGTIRAERQVLVARGGTIDGDVSSREAVVGGEVRGTIVASERIEVQAGAVVHGDITTKLLVVEEGGEVNGHITMGNPPPAASETTDSVSTSSPAASYVRS